MPPTRLQLRSLTQGDPSHDLVWDADADICILALDKFGQECVNLARKWHPELFAQPRLRLFRFEEVEEDGWERYPPGSLEEPDDLDITLAKYLKQNSARLRETAAQFFNQTSLDNQRELARIDGARHDQCILVGSALNVLSMSRAVTLCEELFTDARLINVWRICCLWASSEETRLPAAETKEAIHQSLSWAREGFTRLGNCFTKHETSEFLPLAPQLLAGRSLTQSSPLLPRQDSSVILANAMIGRIYQIRTRIEHGASETEAQSVLEFDYQSYARSGESVGHRLDPEKPFHHLGGFVVRGDVDGVCRAAACALLARWHLLLARQQAPEAADLGPAVERGDQDLKKWIDQRVDRIFDGVTNRMAAAGLARSDASGSFGHSWLQAVLSWQQERENWHKKASESFSWEILSEKPLEDWDQAMQEFDLVTDLFFVRSRDAYLEGFRGAFLRSWDGAIRSGMGKAIEKEISEPASIHFRPNLLCRRLVHAVKARLVLEQTAAEQAEDSAQDKQPFDDATIEATPPVISLRLARFKKALRRAPAPWLWWWLLPGFTILGLHLFQLIDFEFYSQTTPELVFWWRLGFGAAAAIVAGVVSYSWGRRYKRRLQHLFEQWHTLKTEYHLLRLAQQARESSRWAFERAHAFLDAMDPPVEPPSGEPPPGLIMLRQYREVSKHAAAWYRQEACAQLRQLQGSNRELVLPPWPEDDDNAWSELYELCADFIGPQAGAEGVKELQKTLGAILQFFRGKGGVQHLPWLQLEENPEEDELPRWTADMKPDMQNAADGWVVDRSKADPCIDTIATWLKASSQRPSWPVTEWVRNRILPASKVEPKVLSWIENNRLPVFPLRHSTLAASRAIAPDKDAFTDAFFDSRERGNVIQEDGLPFYGFITTSTPVGLEDTLSQFELPTTKKTPVRRRRVTKKKTGSKEKPEA